MIGFDNPAKDAFVTQKSSHESFKDLEVKLYSLDKQAVSARDSLMNQIKTADPVSLTQKIDNPQAKLSGLPTLEKLDLSNFQPKT